MWFSCDFTKWFIIFFQSLKLLAIMAAIRLDDETDSIENTLAVALGDAMAGAVTNRSTTLLDSLASSTWEEVICTCHGICDSIVEFFIFFVS